MSRDIIPSMNSKSNQIKTNGNLKLQPSNSEKIENNNSNNNE